MASHGLSDLRFRRCRIFYKHGTLRRKKRLGDCPVKGKIFSPQVFELVKELEPHNVVSFVPGFALLDEKKQWINEARFERGNLRAYYNEHFDHKSDINFLHPYPGDTIETGSLQAVSPYHVLYASKSVTGIVKEHYRHEMEVYNMPDNVSRERLETVFRSLQVFLPEAASAFAQEVLQMVNFDLFLTDAVAEPYFHIYFKNGQIKISRNDLPATDANLRIETKTKHLEFSMENEWGGDVFMIGYAADIFVITR